VRACPAQGVPLDHYISAAADHHEMLDIVAADQHESSTVIHGRHIDHCHPPQLALLRRASQPFKHELHPLVRILVVHAQ
jgi:hypothetical protein